jgi:hypothetical protein
MTHEDLLFIRIVIVISNQQGKTQQELAICYLIGQANTEGTSYQLLDHLFRRLDLRKLDVIKEYVKMTTIAMWFRRAVVLHKYYC